MWYAQCPSSANGSVVPNGAAMISVRRIAAVLRDMVVQERTVVVLVRVVVGLDRTVAVLDPERVLR